jgi:hypothetical protein
MATKIPEKQNKARGYPAPWTPQAKLKSQWRHKDYLRWWGEICAGWEEKRPERKYPRMGRECAVVAGDLLHRVNYRDGYAFPQLDVIGSSVGTSCANVSRALRKLSAAGFLTIFRACPFLEELILRRRKIHRLHPKQSVYVVHQREDASAIRAWHEKRGIRQRSYQKPHKRVVALEEEKEVTYG